MNVGILGSGDVAKALAAGFLSQGDRVMLGTREPVKLNEWQRNAGSRAMVGSFAETAQFGEWVIIATLGTAAVDAIEQAGVKNFNAKIVIDATNPLRFEQNQVYLAYTDPSNGERVQAAIPDASVVKAFNTAGNALFVKPQFEGARGVMFLAGNDAGAKASVAQLCSDWNWDTSDLGSIEAARYMEALCIVWVRHCRSSGNFAQAFTFASTLITEGDEA